MMLSMPLTHPALRHIVEHNSAVSSTTLDINHVIPIGVYKHIFQSMELQLWRSRELILIFEGVGGQELFPKARNFFKRPIEELGVPKSTEYNSVAFITSIIKQNQDRGRSCNGEARKESELDSSSLQYPRTAFRGHSTGDEASSCQYVQQFSVVVSSLSIAETRSEGFVIMVFDPGIKFSSYLLKNLPKYVWTLTLETPQLSGIMKEFHDNHNMMCYNIASKYTKIIPQSKQLSVMLLDTPTRARGDSGIFKHSMVCSSCGKDVAGGDEAFAQTADFAMVFSTISTTQQYANSVGVVEYKAQVEQKFAAC